MKRTIYRLMLWEGLLCAGLLGALAWRDWTIALGMSRPVAIQVGVFGMEGASHNAYVRFSFLWPRYHGWYVYETNDKARGSMPSWSTGTNEESLDAARRNAWKRVWIPLAHQTHGEAILLLFKSDRMKSPADVERYAQQGTVTGILKSHGSISAAERKNLHSLFPGMTFDSLWILEDKETVLGTTLWLLITGGVVVCLVIALIGAWRLYRLNDEEAGDGDGPQGGVNDALEVGG